MKKPQLALTSAMAATLIALPGCSTQDDWDSNVIADNDTRVCVDQNGNRIDDDECDDDNVRVRTGSSWFYISRYGHIPYYGDSVRDSRYGFKGSYTKSPGAIYSSAPSESRMTRSTAVARGGFGSSGGSYGGGRS